MIPSTSFMAKNGVRFMNEPARGRGVRANPLFRRAPPTLWYGGMGGLSSPPNQPYRLGLTTLTVNRGLSIAMAWATMYRLSPVGFSPADLAIRLSSRCVIVIVIL